VALEYLDAILDGVALAVLEGGAGGLSFLPDSPHAPDKRLPVKGPVCTAASMRRLRFGERVELAAVVVEAVHRERDGQAGISGGIGYLVDAIRNQPCERRLPAFTEGYLPVMTAD